MCWTKFFKSVFLVFALASGHIACNNTGFKSLNVEGLKEFLDLSLIKDKLVRLLGSVEKLKIKKLNKKGYVKNFTKQHTKAVIVRRNGKVFLGEFNEDFSAIVPFTQFGTKFYIIHDMFIHTVYFVQDGEKVKLTFESYDKDQNFKALTKSIEKAGIKPVNFDNLDIYFTDKGNGLLQLFDDAKPNQEKYKNDSAYRLSFVTRHMLGFILRYNGQTFLVKHDPKSKKLSPFDSFRKNFRVNAGLMQGYMMFEKRHAWGSGTYIKIFFTSTASATESLNELGFVLEKANCKVANLEGIDDLKKYYNEESGAILISSEPMNLSDIQKDFGKGIKYQKGIIFWNKDQVYLANSDSKSRSYKPFNAFGEKLYLVTGETPKEVEFRMQDGKIVMDIKEN